MYDSNIDDSGLLGFFCGSSRPATLMSTANVMYVRITTADSVGAAEFSAAYTIQCGAVFRWSRVYQFKSVDRDGDGMYEDNLNCTWTIVGRDYDIIQLNISSMDIEHGENCEHDFLKVRRGPLIQSNFNSSNIF